jgi:hypothetical protein
MALEELNNLEWFEPWRRDFSGLESELRREVSARHPLFGVKAIAVARGDGDDVLFYLPDYSFPLAVVHLTWQKESTSDFPHTLFYSSVDEFVENRMTPDYQEHTEITGKGE